MAVLVTADVPGQTPEGCDRPSRGSRRPLRRPRPIAKAGIPVFGVASLPFVERLSENPKPTADPGDVSLIGRLP